MTGSLSAADPQLGDLDGDGRITIFDIVSIVELSRNGAVGASAATVALADVNQDGVINDTDAAMAAAAAAGLAVLPPLPRLTVRSTSPVSGEDSVSVTRETVFHLTMPLAEAAVVNVGKLHAVFGGRQILSRVEVSSDRRTVTLFYLEPLPGSAGVRVTFDGTGLTDFFGRDVDLDGDGLGGGTAIVDFATLTLTPVANTTVIGRVFASEIKRIPNTESNMVINTPLAKVTITVDGMEESMRAVTDAQGNFRLASAPAGAFFVHIDGRTVTNSAAGIRYPDQSYYPFVGKRWVSVAGQETSIGDVFLPLVVAGTLQPVVAGTPTTVTFPASVLAENPGLAGVSLQVPADSLFSENGNRGGRIGIAPVSPDRLPGPLPPGVNPALVITVQTDGGANFDRPVPICFPNMPDPDTGEVLPPGAKSALWSFNHDTGRFEIVGPMTVSDDGKFVCTDPGVGILAPGWHFAALRTLLRMLGIDCDPAAPPSNQAPPTQSRPPGKPGKSKGPCDPPRTQSGAAGDPVQLFSGEMVEEMIDLYIPGRGFDFNWQRTYRSRTGPDTLQGNGWDHPYNVVVRAAPAGPDMFLFDGNGRADRYTAQANQTWVCGGFFRRLNRFGDGTLRLVFEDRGEWGFYPLDATYRSGRMSYSQDRNGNRMSFTYDAQGRLIVINDTLGRNITVAYNPDGYIASVTDFAGRSVRYTYYKNGDVGGGRGDLRSVTGPAVTGTPNGNDFPDGKTITYTYSTGFADERLNHNLLTVTDGRRNDPADPTVGAGPYLVNVYSSATDPGDPGFDRVIRQVWGGGVLDFVYTPLLPAAPNGFAVMRTIVNDRVGNVSESFFDAANRMVRMRQYTGRAIPDQPTTALDNRPANPLRATDPDYFETLYEWNGDSLLRRVIHPNGNLTEYVYESDLNPGADPRTRGNLRLRRQLPGTHVPAGDQAVIEESFEYESDYGACCGSIFATKETDGRGNVTRHEYDDQGNRIRSRFAMAGVVDEWEYNAFGQLVAHVAPPDSTGNRRRDEAEYYDSGPQKGYTRREIVDATGLRLITGYEYDAVGNVVRVVDPRGNDTLRTVNQLNQLVRILSPEVTPGSGIRYRRDHYYDANNNLVRQDTSNLDENGVVQPNTDFTLRFEYDGLNLPVRVTEEIDETHSSVTEFAYDANRNRVLVRQPEAVNGHQPANVVQTRYDERNLSFQVIAAPGDPAQSTSQTDYDPDGNVVRTLDGIESGGHATLVEFDGYDRMVTVTDASGNRMRRQYDATHNMVHGWTEGEVDDGPGPANNVRLAEVIQSYDSLNRLVRVDRAHFDAVSQQPVGDGLSSVVREYTLTSQLSRVANDNGHLIQFTYDTSHRLQTVVDPKGDTKVRTYDAAGNIVAVTLTEKSDLGGADGNYTTHYVFDSLNRMTRMTDSGGNVTELRYDSRDNPVLALDAARSSANAPGNRTRRVYDGLGRVTQVTRELTSDGTGAGAPAGQIVLRREWDDDSRPSAMYDGNGNATRFVHDPLDRMIQSTIASGAVRTLQLDAHSNPVSVTDPNGTVVHQTFDALDRLVRKDITPGPGVAADTTFEERGYDGLSRLVRAVNDATQVAQGYDSLGNLIRDSIDGRTAQRSYDGVGNPVGTTYPGGRKIAATFDELEQLRSLTDATAATAVPIAGYDYAGPGRVGRRSNGNNTRMEMAYDALKRPVRSTHSVIGGAAFEDRDYGWDANSNQVLNHDRLAGGFSQAYVYDSAYRLRSATFTGALTEQHGYQLDAAGNRLAVTGDADAGSYVRAGAPSTDVVLNQYSSTPFDQRAYDPNGNLKKITAAGQARTLEFDYLNRLVRHEAAGQTTRYVYDALGRRVARVTGAGDAGTVRYAYLGAQVVEEQDGAGVTRASYVFGPMLNEVVSMQRDSKDYWLHEDDQLSVRRVTDPTGKVVESYRYDEFGNPALADATGQPLASSVVGNPYLYTGHRYDPETGFYYARNRYYEPRSGRFITRDPAGAFGDPMGLGNAFAYAGNNPATYVDPLGLSGKAVAVGQFVAKKGAKELVRQGEKLLKQGAAATAEAERISSAAGEEALQWFDAANNEGILVDSAIGTENSMATAGTEFVMEGHLVNAEKSFAQGGPDADLLRRTFASDEEAAAFVNARYADNIRNNTHWNDAARRAQSLEDKGARLAQKASKLKKAGKVLSAVMVVVDTGLAVKEDIDNCAGTGFIVNDAIATAVSKGAVNAVPPLAAADAVTGEAVSQGIHNVLMAPTVISHFAGRMSNRDADNIKSAFTRSPAGKLVWRIGSWLAGD